MKTYLPFVFILALLTSLTSVIAVQAPVAVQITPADPYPSENLLCKYLNFRQEDILEFRIAINDRLIEVKQTDKPSIIFNARDRTQRGDRVLCWVYQVFEVPRERFELRGQIQVVVGQYQCNDGLDNDNDNQIDSRDGDCSARTDDLEGREPFIGEEIIAFCEEHPDNFFCLGLGYLDLQQLCTTHPDNHLCGIMPSEALDPICRQQPDNLICTGKEDPATYCVNLDNLFCRNFMVGEVVFRCERNNQCMEVNRDDKEQLCQLDGSHDFCPAEIRFNPGALGGPCVDVPCGAGLFCNEDLICVQRTCEEDARRNFVCPGAAQVEQVCNQNIWTGDCPPFVCNPGETRTIECGDQSHLVQGCLNNRWVGACPEEGEEEEQESERRERRRIIPPSSPLVPGQQIEREEAVVVNLTGQEQPEIAPLCGDGVCFVDEQCPKDCSTEIEETPIQLPMTGILAVVFVLVGFGVGALVGRRFFQKNKVRKR